MKFHQQRPSKGYIINVAQEYGDNVCKVSILQPERLVKEVGHVKGDDIFAVENAFDMGMQAVVELLEKS